MELIDERGRLFGRVNVVDALVVLLAVAVVAAGLALVFGGGGAEPAVPTDGDVADAATSNTTHATVDLGTRPQYVARLVEPGNVTAGGHNATITDVRRTPTTGDQARVLARMKFEGNRTERGFVVGEDTGEPTILRHGVSFPVTTPDYQLGGNVRTVGDEPTFEGPAAPRDTTHATVDLGTQPRHVARLIATGSVDVDGHDATVTDVHRTPAGGDQVRILARIEFEGNSTERGFVVGEDADDPTTLRYGVSLGLATPDYRVDGSVATVGDDPAFDTRERRVVLNVSTTRAVADAISAGDAQRIAGEPVATVERAEQTARDNETYYVEVELAVETLAVDGREEYAGGPLRLGRSLGFETDRYAVRGTVIEIGS